MNTLEMKNEFLTRYDAATSLAAPGWEDSEISDFLNIGQLRLVSELYRIRNYNPISNIIKTTSALPIAHSSIINAYTLDLSTIITSFLYYVRSRTKLTRNNPTITQEWIPNDILTNQENSGLFYVTPFNKPWFKYPKCYAEFDITESLIVLVDSYTTAVHSIEITWISKPVEINISSSISTDLDLVLHPTIVEYAVEEAIKSIKTSKISNQ